MTDHDVRNLQSRGAEVLVLEPHYTTEDLKQAGADCRGETGKTPNQAEAKSAPTQDSTGNPVSPLPVASSGATSPSVSSPATSGKLSVSSTPGGADIEVDGAFVGNTPSDVQVTDGDHTITVKKAGFKDWERKMKVSGGSSVHLNADLEKVAATQ